MQTHFPLVYSYLGGGFNPFEKYARQTGSFPQVGMKKKYSKAQAWYSLPGGELSEEDGHTHSDETHLRCTPIMFNFAGYLNRQIQNVCYWDHNEIHPHKTNIWKIKSIL